VIGHGSLVDPEPRYNPEHIREGLMPVRFGHEAAGKNDELYSMLRRASLK